LGQVSLDLAEQGINTLWGSFEIKNTRLLHKLLKQFSRQALPDIHGPNAVEVYDALADRFETLPLHFMRFHGGSEVDEVLDAMEYAVYVNDVEHIILDNMQFMITRNVTGGSKWDKFDTQDIAIEKFRKFATEHNVHVSLVVHPRKEDESSKLSMSSFYGSAKATQEADTVIILQNDGRRKDIEVKENRFDGAFWDMRRSTFSRRVVATSKQKAEETLAVVVVVANHSNR
jgi:twinkle protein